MKSVLRALTAMSYHEVVGYFALLVGLGTIWALFGLDIAILATIPCCGVLMVCVGLETREVPTDD